jgi:hypothetical protein
MRFLPVLTLALLLSAWPVAAIEKQAATSSQPTVFSVVILQETSLRDAIGAEIARLAPYDVLQLLSPKGNDLLVLWQKDKEKEQQASISAESAAIVLGPPAKHVRRLERLRQANMRPDVKSRLMAGHIAEGDNMWQVEMAWGRPERSFMVNYLSDEQHFVYLTPNGKPVLLRFVSGALQGPLPASTRAAAAQVESPSSPR